MPGSPPQPPGVKEYCMRRVCAGEVAEQRLRRLLAHEPLRTSGDVQHPLKSEGEPCPSVRGKG